MAMKNPPHAGRGIRENCLVPLGLNVTEAAGVLGVARHTLSRVLNGQAAISPEMAIRLEKAGWSNAEFWLRRQTTCDLARARKLQTPSQAGREYNMRASIWILVGGLWLGPDPVSSQDDQRRWLPEPILTATIADPSGDLFGNPWHLVADPRGGFLIAEDVTIHSFDVDGTRRWSAGRDGGGPGEFTAIRDLDVTPDGQVLVLDRDMPRLTVFDGSSGELTTTVSLPRGRATRDRYGLDAVVGSQVLPAREALARVGVRAPEGLPLWTLRADGSGVEGSWLPVTCSHGLTCDMLTIGDGSWGAAVAFRWSSRLAFLNPDGSVRALADGIDGIPFPDVASNVQEVGGTVAGSPRLIPMRQNTPER